MPDVTAILARLAATQPAVIRIVDPTSNTIREVSVDPVIAGAVTPDTVFVPLRTSLPHRLQATLRMNDEERAAVEEAIEAMVAECAVTPLDDDALRQAVEHLAACGFDIVEAARG